MRFVGRRPPFASNNLALSKTSPHARGVKADITDIFEICVLKFKLACIWRSPTQTNKINLFDCSKVDHYPLRVFARRFTCVSLIEIGIAFPKGFSVAIDEP